MARILIVDDEVAVQASLRRALELDGHWIEVASDGAEGLARLTANAEIALLVSDIHMPIMDGIALTLAVAAEKPGFPIVLMTGYAEQHERARELEGLVEAVLPKPFTLNEFRAAIQAVIARRAP